MKKIKFLLLIVLGAVLFNSCSSDDNDKIPPVVKSSMKLVKSLNVNEHIVELYSTHKDFLVGYNPIEVMVKNATTNEYFNNVELNNFMPMMHMTNMMHSCPKSETFESMKNGGMAKGFAVFIMPSNDSEPWEVSFKYKVNGHEYSVNNQKIKVTNPERAMLAKGKGTDGKKYFMAYIEPMQPKIGVNNITTKVYTMKNMKEFPEVENYKILLDPRMPGMGNHSSPNNEPLTYQDGIYKGKVNFSMTGYWKLNLQLVNPEGKVVLGNAVAKDDHEGSSKLYWEIEF